MLWSHPIHIQIQKNNSNVIIQHYFPSLTSIKDLN